MLTVTIYESVRTDNGDTIEPLEPVTADYVSLVSSGTYGKPALIAPGKAGEARAEIGETVLYVNTSFVPLFEIERTSD